MKRMRLLLSTLLFLSITSSFAVTRGEDATPLTLYLPSVSWNKNDYAGYISSIYKDNPNAPDIPYEIVVFDSADEFNMQLAAEVLAGAGPDIFYFLPEEMKLSTHTFISRSAFLNLAPYLSSDASIDMKDYQQEIMQAGIYGDHIYLLPLRYGFTSLWLTTQEALDMYGITVDDTMTYHALYNASSHAKQAIVGGKVQPFADFPFNSIIQHYMDYDNYTCSFDSQAFSDMVDIMLGLTPRQESLGTARTEQWGLHKALRDQKVLFISMPYQYGLVENQYNILSQGFHKTPRLVQITEGAITAEIHAYVAINANTKHPEEAYAFVRYLLSREVQQGLVGTIIFGAYPVYSALQAHQLQEYRENGVQVGRPEPVTGSLKVKLPDAVFDAYEKAVLSIEHAYIPDYKYMAEIYMPLWESLLQGKLDKELFIHRLQSRTMLYLAE